MTFDLDAIGRGLPVLGAVDELVATLRGDRGNPVPRAVHSFTQSLGVAVVEAPPGTGKTTLVPPLVANLTPGRVLVSQPRRIAARAAARRLASLTGTHVGELAGYVVRGDVVTGPSTRVEFCTAGVLLRRLLADPELPGVGAVVLDEVHERALETDLAFGMLAELRELRPDLGLVVMSATLDADRWAGLLGGAPVVRVSADLHPLEVRWAPAQGARQDARGVTPAFLDHLASVAAGCVAEAPDGGRVLAFAPGARECDQVVSRLVSRGVDAAALHGSLAPREQDAILSGAHRVVVATSIAESSLTVPGVRVVVDSGLSREPRRDRARGMSGLVTVAEPRSSAEQRAGRAARLGPGVVVRCFPEADWHRLRPFTMPEVLTADLTRAALDLACWGSPGGIGLPLPDSLPTEALGDALAVLHGLGAVDETGRATARGRALALLPVEPRLGRALVKCAPVVGRRRAAEVVALLSGDERMVGGDLLAVWRSTKGSPVLRRESDRLERMIPGDHGDPRAGRGVGDEEAVSLVVGSAWPDRIARRRPGTDDYLTVSGTGVTLPSDSRLKGAEWLAVAEVARVGERAVVRSGAIASQDLAQRCASELLVRETIGRFTDGRVTARVVTRLGALELTSTPVSATPEVGRAALAEALRTQGLRGVLDWREGVQTLRCRLAVLHHALGDPWPAMDDESLLDRADEWLAPELDRLAEGGSASSLDLTSALRRLLPWPAAARLDELVPERIEVPTGAMIRLDYPEDPADRVVLSVKLQECFGMVDTPRIVDGRVPVLMHLLSPAQRPLAVTDDLASFWTNAYPSVRAENRGRYIKHPWPEDPLTAPPRRGTTRSGR
ncbi:ATP-dependent helicase HrpB [Luteococcus sanguinis]|uniref:RNA helicase n=1 Tax=Luteococcus sanguinis TaxID=174038 RepID=A0ABW1WXF2_9ACTN